MRAKKTGILANSTIAMAIITFCLWIWLFTPYFCLARGLYRINNLTEGKELIFVLQEEDIIVFESVKESDFLSVTEFAVFSEGSRHYHFMWQENVLQPNIVNEGVYLCYNNVCKRYEEMGEPSAYSVFLPSVTGSSK